MKTFIEAAAVLVFTFLVGISLNAEALNSGMLNSLEEVENFALANNLEYKTAVLDTVKAYNNLEYFFTLDESEISFSGSYSTDESNETSLSASISLPLFDQLSLSASTDEELESCLGFTLSPLAHSDSLEQSKLVYTAALASAENIAEEVSLAAVEDYLTWATAAKELKVAEKTADVMQTIYEDEKIRMETGESVLDDVREAFIDWSEARSDYNTALTGFQQAETDLYSRLNADSGTTDILPPGHEELFAATEKLLSIVDVSLLSVNGTWELLSASLDTESLEAELDSTWFFEPDLSISGGINLSPDSAPELTATLSVTAGLDDFKGDDIEELKTELAISREIEAQRISEQSLELSQAVTTAGTARLEFEKAETELEQAEELYLEAKFLYELGEYSAAELEETRLIFESSKNSLFSAAADQYTALRTLATFMP